MSPVFTIINHALLNGINAIREAMPECRGLDWLDESERAYELRAVLWSEKFQENAVVRFFVPQDLVDEPELHWVAIDLLRAKLQEMEAERAEPSN